MKRYSYWILLSGTLLMIVVMAMTGASLKTPDTPGGIIDLEFARNTTQVNEVLKAWTPTSSIDNIKAAKLNTWLDFIFLFFYSFFLAASCNRMALALQGTGGRAGMLMAQAALLAGFLDILENAGMLISLNGTVSNNIAMLTWCFSLLKWAMVVMVIVYLLYGLIILGFRISKRKGKV